MKRLPLALALGALCLAFAHPGSAATFADTCGFAHPIGYWATFDPPRPCAGAPVSLVVHTCADCDHVVGFGRADDGSIYLQFTAPAVCPETFACRAESLLVPLGVFQPGQHSIVVHSHERVITDPVDSLGCDV